MANPKCEGSFSVYNKELKLLVNEEEYDLSNRVDCKTWKLDDWEIRNSLFTIVKNFIKEIDFEVRDKDIRIMI